VTDRQSDRPTDKPTDHATRSITIGRIYVRSTAMRHNNKLEMWANTQPDGRPAEYRWRQRRKVWLTPTTRVPCNNAAKTRNHLQGCLKLVNRSQPPIGRSSPYCEDMWRRYCCLTFFPIVDMCLSCEDIARQSCAMVPRWRIFGHFCVLHFQRAARSTFQTCILNSHQGHAMCRSMVDIQSAAAEIRRGKKKEKDRNHRAKI